MGVWRLTAGDMGALAGRSVTCEKAPHLAGNRERLPAYRARQAHETIPIPISIASL
jgi:hypothetical protein